MDQDEVKEKVLGHGYRLEAIEKILEKHSEAIEKLGKLQNKLLLALIVVTIVGSDSATPLVTKLFGAL